MEISKSRAFKQIEKGDKGSKKSKKVNERKFY